MGDEVRSERDLLEAYRIRFDSEGYLYAMMPDGLMAFRPSGLKSRGVGIGIGICICIRLAGYTVFEDAVDRGVFDYSLLARMAGYDRLFDLPRVAVRRR